jgi:hypothetical protein
MSVFLLPKNVEMVIFIQNLKSKNADFKKFQPKIMLRHTHTFQNTQNEQPMFGQKHIGFNVESNCPNTRNNSAVTMDFEDKKDINKLMVRHLTT